MSGRTSSEPTSTLTYLPATGPGTPTVVYVAKGSETAQRLAERAFGPRWQRSVSLIFGWDDGSYSGRTLLALIGPSQRCKAMYVLTDLSWRGLVSACRVLRMCKPARPVLLGIDKEWLAIAERAFPNAGYVVNERPEDLAVRMSPRERSGLLKELKVGPAERDLLEAGKEVHLDAFAHDAVAPAVAKLLKGRISPGRRS